MKGLELARMFFESSAPLLFDGIDDEIQKHATVGLVGEGSECFGFDDVRSRDHDWGAGFCVWLSSADYAFASSALLENYRHLSSGDTFQQFPIRKLNSASAPARIGIFETDAFYKRLLGIGHAPQNIEDWDALSETALASATNGELFQVGASGFAETRRVLLAYYPEDLRKKRIATYCLIIAQAGQYNYPRELNRRDFLAAFQALDRFIEASLALVYALNKRYRPYYKWVAHGLPQLPHLGKKLYAKTQELVLAFQDRRFEESTHAIEEICLLIMEELQRQELSRSSQTFFVEQAAQVNMGIKDARLRSKPIPAELPS